MTMKCETIKLMGATQRVICDDISKGFISKIPNYKTTGKIFII